MGFVIPVETGSDNRLKLFRLALKENFSSIPKRYRNNLAVYVAARDTTNNRADRAKKDSSRHSPSKLFTD